MSNFIAAYIDKSDKGGHTKEYGEFLDDYFGPHKYGIKPLGANEVIRRHNGIEVLKEQVPDAILKAFGWGWACEENPSPNPKATAIEMKEKTEKVYTEDEVFHILALAGCGADRVGDIMVVYNGK